MTNKKVCKRLGEARARTEEKQLIQQMRECIKELHGGILVALSIMENTAPKDLTSIADLRHTLAEAKPGRFR